MFHALLGKFGVKIFSRKPRENCTAMMREGCLIKYDHSLSRYQSPILRECGKEHTRLQERLGGEKERGGRRAQEEETGEYQHPQTDGFGLGRRRALEGMSTHSALRTRISHAHA